MVGSRPTSDRPVRAATWMMIRMTTPIVAVCALLLTVGVGAAWYVHRLNRNTSELLAQDVSSVRAAAELVITVRQMATHLDQFLLTGERKQLDAIRALRTETERWLGEITRLSTTDRERVLVTRFEAAHERFWGELTRFERRAGPRDSPPEIKNIREDLLDTGLLAPAQEYLDLNEAFVARTTAQVRAMPERIALVLLLLGTCGAVVGLIAGLGIARGISRSIVQLSVPIRDAAGKLDQVVGPISLSADWDVEDLEAVMRSMADKIGTIVAQAEQNRREVLRAEQLAALGQLAAGLAHELRNPLTAIKVLVQSAVERGDSAGLRGRRLAVLEEEVGRLEGSIQTFLDFARPPQLEKRPFDLRGVLEQTLILVSGRAELKAVAIESSLPDGPMPIVADMGGVRHVLLNLLLNALDATPKDGALSVDVAWGPECRGRSGPLATIGQGEGHDAWLTIRVADSGCGLPTDLGESIFEPFVSTKDTGLGLGLSICKRIVEDHGGEITAVDRPGGGAVFTVRLPVGGGQGLHAGR